MSDLIKREYAIKRFGEDGTWLERQGVTTLTMVEAKQRAIDILESLPSADAVEMVRCKDCRHRDLFSCPLADNDFQKDEDFCSWGERIEP